MGDARHEIARLIFLCDERNDDGDFDGVGELFADAVIGVEGNLPRHALHKASQASIADGIQVARESIASGRARAKVDELVRFTQQFKQ